MTQSPDPTDSVPYRWGDPAHAVQLKPGMRDTLRQLGADTAAASVEPEQATVPDSRLPDDFRRRLVAIVGERHVDDSHQSRVAHAGGWSTTDLLRLRSGDAHAAPDLVAYPASHDEVVQILQECMRAKVAVVPYSGGTSVVGGLEPSRDGFAGILTIDLRRLDAVTDVDPVSRTATLQAGLRGPQVEKELQQHGFTLGHFPQSYEFASVGGYAAARSAGQASAGYGRFDEMVVGLVLATPNGTLQLGTAPMSATGPDLRQLILGSEGAFGVVTSVAVVIRPIPQRREYDGWAFDDFDTGTRALRALAQEGPHVAVVRLSDEAETAVNLSNPSKMLEGGPGGCLAIVGFEGTHDDVSRQRDQVEELFTHHGGRPADPEAGPSWERGRFAAPYLRDALLDEGMLVETLETAGFWSKLPQIRAAVTGALTQELNDDGRHALVLCHISHVYETGASLYFTVACAQSDDPVGQWNAAKEAANKAIRSAGGAISHHHGIGTVHRSIYHAEIGELGMETLRAVKAVMDPAGVCNPGVLIAPEAADATL